MQSTLIMKQSLELGAELGQGEFGSVLKGIWTDPKGNKVRRSMWHDLVLCLSQYQNGSTPAVMNSSGPEFSLLQPLYCTPFPYLYSSISFYVAPTSKAINGPCLSVPCPFQIWSHDGYIRTHLFQISCSKLFIPWIHTVNSLNHLTPTIWLLILPYSCIHTYIYFI